ncbi:outer membrane protein transport protein [Arenibacter sp. BSSL-BM3]|uniref:Outer membrane protein transport protein n=1 Tax=Arenibacter arenosicollis TaxID=2762274 RepID=A0ABR7QR90_9FLAO|nr:outer membrane protein transport protein [Arenibacter arenosicollis]MBC8769715.1 outer membrane protein transport protein [Arenibacter arenosicollis]
MYKLTSNILGFSGISSGPVLTFFVLVLGLQVQAQVGHVLQGVGGVNTSMGGAATAQPLDISGALLWNPASLSSFDGQRMSVNVGLFFSDPSISSTVPTQNGPFSGSTGDDRGVSVLPSLAYVWGKAESKHNYGISAFGVSGFGVTFPESQNNPITMPQSSGGFGRIESDYALLQVSFAYTYQLTDKISLGIQPNFNYATLEIGPNPLAAPSPTLGYPNSDKANAIGIGAQLGLFYDSGNGLKLGASYKSKQVFNDFSFSNTYLDGTEAPGVDFNMDYPAIYSLGLGYSKGDFDYALDYRFIDYENSDGFRKSGWQLAESGDFAGFPTGAVQGFGWQSISVISTGLQYKGVQRLPLRIGYTYSENPIQEEFVFMSSPATAVIKNAFQFGFSYKVSERLNLDVAYHHGTSSGSTSGPLLNPTPDSAGGPWNANTNPSGAIPGSEVAYDMTTDLVIVGFNYSFGQ